MNGGQTIKKVKLFDINIYLTYFLFLHLSQNTHTHKQKTIWVLYSEKQVA